MRFYEVIIFEFVLSLIWVIKILKRSYTRVKLGQENPNPYVSNSKRHFLKDFQLKLLYADIAKKLRKFSAYETISTFSTENESNAAIFIPQFEI